MKFVHMHQGLVWFPAVGVLFITGGFPWWIFYDDHFDVRSLLRLGIPVRSAGLYPEG